MAANTTAKRIAFFTIEPLFAMLMVGVLVAPLPMFVLMIDWRFVGIKNDCADNCHAFGDRSHVIERVLFAWRHVRAT